VSLYPVKECLSNDEKVKKKKEWVLPNKKRNVRG
jgi:hypothetical protein